jgi:hypothetical protein
MPTDSDLPRPIGEVLREVAPIWRGGDDPAPVHPFGGNCKVCEKPLEQLWRQIDPSRAPGWFAVNCCETCYEEAKTSNTPLSERMKVWEHNCPIEFKKPWDNRLGNNQVLSKVLNFNPSNGRGMVVHGTSGTGKTRIAWRLLHRLSEEAVQWLFIESADLMEAVPEACYHVPVLVIDDLGNDPLSGTKESRLLKLLRNRIDWHKPVIVTTQYNGESLGGRFSDSNTAQAVIRRLRAFCESVSSNLR